MRNEKIISIAVVPDRMAHYRLAVFRALAHLDQSKFEFIYFGEKKDDIGDIKLIDPGEFIYNNGRIIEWKETTDIYYKGRCLWQSRLIRVALSKRYKILILWGESHRLSTWIAAFLARLKGKKVVFWTHGLYGSENLLKKWFRIVFYRLGNAILLYGSYAKGLLSPFIPDSKLYVINNSLDVAEQNLIYNTLSHEDKIILYNKLTNSSGKLIGFVGRLTSVKKLELLLEAIAILKGKGVYGYVIFIGDGEQKGILGLLSRSLGVEEQVIFYGECYANEILIPLLSACDVVVSPGNVGLTAMHALISGTPVITHSNASKQMPEFEAVIDGVSGFLFKEGSIDDLVEKIILCLDLIKQGLINNESCRSIVLERYSPEYQLSIFRKVLTSV